MANIDQYLNAIMTAVYGEEVRGSIHDAIKLINNDVEAGVDASEMEYFDITYDYDLNDFTKTGRMLYGRTNTDDVSKTVRNSPPNASSSFAILSLSTSSGDSYTQLYLSVGSNKVYVRRKTSGVWSLWSDFAMGDGVVKSVNNLMPNDAGNIDIPTVGFTNYQPHAGLVPSLNDPQVGRPYILTTVNGPLNDPKWQAFTTETSAYGDQLALHFNNKTTSPYATLPKFSETTPGVVPAAPASGANSKFLRGDGEWVTVSGGTTSGPVTSVNGITPDSSGDVILNISGTNYFLDPYVSKSKESELSRGCSWTYDEETGKYTLTLTSTANSPQVFLLGVTNNMTSYYGDNFIVSIQDLEVSDEALDPRFYFYNTTDDSYSGSTSILIKDMKNITISNDASYPKCGILFRMHQGRPEESSIGATMSFKIKLEQGNVVTPWSPSPWDFQPKLDKTTNKKYQHNLVITSTRSSDALDTRICLSLISESNNKMSDINDVSNILESSGFTSVGTMHSISGCFWSYEYNGYANAFGIYKTKYTLEFHGVDQDGNVIFSGISIPNYDDKWIITDTVIEL